MKTFNVETEKVGTTLHVRLFGEFDLLAYDNVDEVLSDAQAHDQPDMVVDLRGLSFIDSSGIRALLRANLRAEEAGGTLKLLAGPANVQRVFEVAGLGTKLHFIASDPA